MAVSVRTSPGRLLDRGEELDAIAELLEAGDGRALVFTGAAGLGKSALVAEACTAAGEQGRRVLTARGAELERDFPWCASVSLFQRALATLDPGARNAALDGPAAAAGRVLGMDEGEPPATAPEFATVHGLFALTCALAEPSGALIAVDDVQWLDAMSMRFVLYLLERIDELNVTIVLAVRSDIPGPRPPLLEALLGHANSEVVELQPLSAEAIAELVREAHEHATEEVCDRCWELTAGNPFYLRELLLAMEEFDGQAIGPMRAIRPPARVVRSVLARLRRLGPAAIELANVVALLGDDVPLHRACAVGELEMSDATRAADALASAQILARGEPLRYVHALVRAAVYHDIPVAARAERHLRAAWLLAGTGAAPEVVGAHLLEVPARGSAWVVDRLVEAADHASEQGGAGSAVPFLERAVAEPADPERAPKLLLSLALALASAGDTRASDAFDRALAAIPDAAERALGCERLGHAHFSATEPLAAAAAFELGLSQCTDADHEIARRLQAGFVAAATWHEATRARALARLAAIPYEGNRGSTYGERALLVGHALQRSLAAAPRSEVAALCERAWGDGALLEDDGVDGMHWPLLALSLFHADELDRQFALVKTMFTEIRRKVAPRAFVTASWCQAGIHFERGSISASLADLKVVLDGCRFGWSEHQTAVHSLYARCLFERGDTEGAMRALASLSDLQGSDSPEIGFLLTVRARMLLASGDAQGALQLNLTAGRIIEELFQVTTPSMLPWRSLAAGAHKALGDREAALALIEEELAVARAADVRRSISRALRAKGSVLGGEEGIAAHDEAVAILDGAGPRLQRVHALIGLGSALRRMGRRVDAREPLREALALAMAGGAHASARRARDELAASGARLRRAAEARDELTPSELRVCKLAAAGSTNQEIANTLFIGIKTVETHLHRSYLKLGVARRRQLAEALGE